MLWFPHQSDHDFLFSSVFLSAAAAKAYPVEWNVEAGMTFKSHDF